MINRRALTRSGIELNVVRLKTFKRRLISRRTELTRCTAASADAMIDCDTLRGISSILSRVRIPVVLASQLIQAMDVDLDGHSKEQAFWISLLFLQGTLDSSIYKKPPPEYTLPELLLHTSPGGTHEGVMAACTFMTDNGILSLDDKGVYKAATDAKELDKFVKWCNKAYESQWKSVLKRVSEIIGSGAST